MYGLFSDFFTVAKMNGSLYINIYFFLNFILIKLFTATPKIAKMYCSNQKNLK